jgi:hypothetical protein
VQSRASSSKRPLWIELIQPDSRRNSCGWPKKSRHGDKALSDAWLLAQHSDHDPKFQQRTLRLLESAVRSGEAPAGQLAYLTDRVATAAGKPQLYGTQFNVVGKCTLEPLPVDDLASVETRRKSLGMPTLAEYRTELQRQALPPQCRSSEAKQ